jgi:hypothetical protein
MTVWVMDRVSEVVKDLIIIASGFTLLMIGIRFLA